MNKEFVVNNKYIFDGEQLELYIQDDGVSKIKEKNKKDQTKNDKDILYKLVFNVSNACNLNCKYCYADGGNYNRKNSLMTLETSDKIVKDVCNKYKEIKTVYFFGGEPLLNFQVIKNVVLKLEKHYGKNTIDFRTVTNGLFLTNKRIDFLDEHNFKLYISLDGPKSIHEYLRGINTFNIIKGQLDYIKQNNKTLTVEILCTYTKYHQDNISFDELIDFFEGLGFRYSINGVDTNDFLLKLQENKSFIEREKEHIDISIERILSNSDNVGISYFLSSVIDALLFHNKQEYFCKELGNNYSNVYDFNGDIYSCIRLLGKFKIDTKEIMKANSKKNKICQNCWCKNLCNICIAEILLNVNEYPFRNNECDTKLLYEYALNKIIHLLEFEQEKLQILLNNYCAKYLK